MKRVFIYSVTLLLLYSCRQNKTVQQSIVVQQLADSLVARDSSKAEFDTATRSKATAVEQDSSSFTKINDSTYSFSSFDGEDLDVGYQGTAYYMHNRIKKITMTDFSCLHQNIVTYTFLKDKRILLSEREYVFPNGMEAGKKDNGRQFSRDIYCYIDSNGSPIDHKAIDSTQVPPAGIGDFPDIKKTVPFTIAH